MSVRSYVRRRVGAYLGEVEARGEPTPTDPVPLRTEQHILHLLLTLVICGLWVPWHRVASHIPKEH